MTATSLFVLPKSFENMPMVFGFWLLVIGDW
jgi:hypothetical protein